jgi:ribosomal protein S18 acetylase RimI-like enzyme
MHFSIRPFRESDADAVIALWEESGLTRPWNDPRLDIARKMAVQPEGFLVAVTSAERDRGDAASEVVIGSVMSGYDGHRGWLYYLATAQTHRRRGVARGLVDAAEAVLGAMGCPKVQLMVREGNEHVLGFYDALGYERFSVSQTGKRLVVDA